MRDIQREIADKYQEFFNFMSQEHNLTLTISEMDEIVIEAQALVKKLSIASIGSKRPTDEQINEWVQWIDKRCNFSDHQKDYVHFGIRQIFKAACASEKGGEKGVSGGAWLVDDGEGNKIKPGQA